MSIVENFILSFLATVGFSIVFNAPKKSLHLCGICGAVGWTIYIMLKQSHLGSINSNLVASLVIGLMGEIFARVDKKPVSVFVIPGIICLVPGYGIYNTMINLMEKDYAQASKIGFESIFIAGAIATGIILISSIFKVFSKHKIEQNK